jgi:hypothetical protein
MHVLLQGLKIAVVSVLFGVIIALIFRHRQTAQVLGSLFLTIVVSAFLEWRFGGPNEWSWHDPVTSLAYLAGPALFFIYWPMVGAALFVGRICTRHNASNQALQPTAGRSDV